MRKPRIRPLNGLLMAVLFSAMGGMFYFLTTGISGSAGYAIKVLPVVIVMFNVFGFSIIRINSRLARRPPLFFGDAGRMFWNIVLISVILLLLNYFTIVAVKWFLGIHPVWGISKQLVKMLLVCWVVELMVVHLLLALHSSRHLLRLYNERERLSEAVGEARYQALQKQLNPHFLFNSLNTLIAEIRYNPENAVRFTQHLSDVYRYVLRQEDKQLVSLGDELGFLDSYLFLHRVRLGDSLRLDSRIPPGALAAKLPPLALQLLVENVVKHNNIDDGHPVDIRMTVVDGGASLVVSNVLHPKQGQHPSGRGLANLAERYRLLCGRTVEVRKTEDRFTVSIPLIYE